MRRPLILAVVLALTVAAPVAAKGRPAPRLAEAALTIDPAAPQYGQELTVSGAPVFRLACYQQGVLVFADGGNTNDPTVTLASLSWTGGATTCLVESREQDEATGLVRTVAELQFDVLP